MSRRYHTNATTKPGTTATAIHIHGSPWQLSNHSSRGDAEEDAASELPGRTAAAATAAVVVFGAVVGWEDT